MASTYLELVNKINALVNEVPLSSSNFATANGFYQTAKEAVNFAIRKINQEQFEWPFYHVLHTETLVTGQTRYNREADCKYIDYDTFRVPRDLTLNTQTVKLERIDYDEFVEKLSDYEYNRDRDAVPSFVFQTQNGGFGVCPAPDQDYDLVYEYYSIPVDLSVWSDTSPLPDGFDHIIVNGAMNYVYHFRGDFEMADRYERMYQESIKDMRTIYINRTDSVRSSFIPQPKVITSKYV